MAPRLDDRGGQDQREPDHEAHRVRAEGERARDPDGQHQEAQPRDGAEGPAAGDLAAQEGRGGAAQAAEVQRLERGAGDQAHREERAEQRKREGRGAGGEREVRSLDGMEPHLSPLEPPSPPGPSPRPSPSNSRPSRTSRSTNAPKPSPRPTKVPRGSVPKRRSIA